VLVLIQSPTIVVQELVYRCAFMRPVFHFTVTPECLCRGSSIHHGSPIKYFGDDERENHRMTVTSYMNHYISRSNKDQGESVRQVFSGFFIILLFVVVL